MSLQKPGSISKTILLTGFLAGSLDIVSACTWAYISGGTNPVVILKFIAAGAFGREPAFSGGYVMALCGLFFHFVIAYSWTVLFFLVYPYIKILSKNRILTAIGYGLFIWGVMNLIVLPMTKLPPAHITMKSAIIGSVILIVAIGLPVSWMANRYFSK